MTTFQDDWESAYHEVYGVHGMPDLRAKKPARKPAKKKLVKPRHVKLIMAPPAQPGRTGHSSLLKKVRSENAKEQPRSRGKFGHKSGFIGRLFGARRRVNASIRAEQRRSAAAGRATIPMQRKPRRRRQVKREEVQSVNYRKSVLRQILGF